MGCASSQGRLVLVNEDVARGVPAREDAGLFIGHSDMLTRAEDRAGDGSGRKQKWPLSPPGVIPDVMDPRLVQKTIRIFLSSTFTDTRLDRNTLMEKVFEPMRATCQEHGIAFEVVDLRWGVRQESVDDHRVLKICMEEIKRCQETSLGIAFIAILGDKYGWRPLPPLVTAEELETLLQHIDQSEHDLINTWYLRDDNSVPPCYQLRPISTQFPINSTDKEEVSKAWTDWEQVQKQIWSQLKAAAGKAGLDEQEKQKYTVSVTHREVEMGVTSDPQANQRCVVVDRRFDEIADTDISAAKYIDMQDGKKDQECMELITELKDERIPAHLGVAQLLKFTNLRWHREGLNVDQHGDYINEMCTRVKELLLNRLQEVLKSIGAPNPLQEEVIRHAIFCRDHTHFFQGRADILGTIHNYVTSDNSTRDLLVMYGESGVGKTSLMAKAILEIQEKYKEKNLVVMYRFCGTTPGSSTGRDLTQSLCEQIKQVYGVEKDVPEDYKSLCEEFPEFMARATKERPLCILIDSLDQLSDANGGRRFLEWLPRQLPDHIHLIVSTLPREGGCLERLKTFGLPESQMLQVRRLVPSDGAVILDSWLMAANRTLTSQQREVVLEAFNRCPLPLYLQLLFSKCRSWPSYRNIDDITLEPNVTGMINSLYQDLEKYHGQLLVSRVLALLAAETDGMNVDDVLNVLSCDETLLHDVLVWHQPPKRRLPPLLLARLKHDLGAFLVERGAHGVVMLALYHRQFWQVARERYLGGERHKETHSAIAKYFSGEYHTRFGKERIIPPQPYAYSAVALNLRKLDRLPSALLEAREFETLRSTLGDLLFVQAKCMAGMGYDLLTKATAAFHYSSEENAEKKVCQDFQDILTFLRSELHILSKTPILTYQQAATYPENSYIAQAAKERLQTLSQEELTHIPSPKGWLEWHNKPEVSEAFELELSGHSKDVLTTCISKDGKTILSGSVDCTIRVWDSQTGELLAQLEGHQGAVTCVRLSPEETVIASCSGDKTIRLWKYACPTYDVIKILEGHTDSVTHLAISPAGKRLLSSSTDKTLKIWDLTSGEVLGTLTDHKGFPLSCAWSPLDESIAASSGDQLEVYIWDLENQRVKMKLEGHQLDENPNFPDKDMLGNLSQIDYRSVVWSVAFSPDGKLLASTGVDTDVMLWDVESGSRIWTFNLPNDGSTLAFVQTEHGMRLAAGSSQHQTITLFDVSTQFQTLALLGGHSGWVMDVAFSGDGSLIASASRDNTVRVWDSTAAEKLKDARFHSERCWSVAYSYDGKWLASASDDFKVCVWNMETSQPYLTYTGHEKKRTFSCGIRACAFSHDSNLVASGGDELKIRIWSRETGQDQIVLPCEGFLLPWCLRFSRDDTRLISVGEFSTGVIVWDLKSQTKIRELTEHKLFCQYTEFSPSGKFIVSCGIDNTARLWDGNSYEHITTLAHPNWATCATFSHDEKMIATCSKDQLVRLWDATSFRELCAMKGHNSEIRMVAFSPRDRSVASAALDQTIRIWDCQTHEQIQIYYAASGVWALAWHPTQDSLLTAGDAVGYLYFLKLHKRNGEIEKKEEEE